jgi:hypothetical protein
MKVAISLSSVCGAVLLGVNVCTADPAVYDAVLSALNKPGHDWAVHLDELEKSLILTGTDPAEARAAILATIRDTRVPTGWEIDIVRISRDIGAVMGTGIVRETQLLTNALGAGHTVISEYELSRGLSAEDIQETRRQMMGASADKIEFVLSRLKARFGGKYEALHAAGQR